MLSLVMTALLASHRLPTHADCTGTTGPDHIPMSEAATCREGRADSGQAAAEKGKGLAQGSRGNGGSMGVIPMRMYETVSYTNTWLSAAHDHLLHWSSPSHMCVFGHTHLH